VKYTDTTWTERGCNPADNVGALLQCFAGHDEDALPGKTFGRFDHCVGRGAAVYHPILREEFVDTGLHVKGVLATNCDPIGACERRGDADGSARVDKSRRDGFESACEPLRLATRRSGVASSRHNDLNDCTPMLK